MNAPDVSRRRVGLGAILAVLWSSAALGAGAPKGTHCGTMIRVEALLYSGRENPAWTLSRSEADELRRRLAALAVERTPAQPFDGLGYRGLQIVDDCGQTNRSLVVDRGVVRSTRDGRAEDRSDGDRAVETFLLKTGRAALGDDVLDALLKSL